MRIPGLVRGRQFGILVGLADRRRHREEAPLERAGLQVVGRHVAAHRAVTHVGAAVADDDDAARDLRRAGARIRQLAIDDGVGFPELLARWRRSSACSRPSTEATKTLPFHTATPRLTRSQQGFLAHEGIGLGVVAPQLLAGGGIHRVDVAPGPRCVHDPVDDDRRRFLAALRLAQIIAPRETQLIDVARRRSSSKAKSRCRPCRARR